MSFVKWTSSYGEITYDTSTNVYNTNELLTMHLKRASGLHAHGLGNPCSLGSLNRAIRKDLAWINPKVIEGQELLENWKETSQLSPGTVH
jgi:hypothetical protein